MTGKDVYNRAIDSLGYADDQQLKNKALTAVNMIADRVSAAVEGAEYTVCKSLSDTLELPDKVMSAMVYGVAERLALGEGDGELQQYFAAQFDRAMARLNRVDRIQDVMPRGW